MGSQRAAWLRSQPLNAPLTTLPPSPLPNSHCAQALLRWATQRGVCVLPKSRRRAGIEENAGACAFELTDDQLSALDALETDRPSYWDPNCVDVLDTFNVFLDKATLLQGQGQIAS